MDTRFLIDQIDSEIAKLKRAREALAVLSSSGMPQKGRGRLPKTASTAPGAAPTRRTLSPEAKAKIAAAQKKRWAVQKKTNKKTA